MMAQLPNAAPEALRDLPAWLAWVFVQKPGKKKPDKVPIYVDGPHKGKRRSGIQGTAADRAGLATFDVAREFASSHQLTGVGFATLPEWGVVALDFDDCVSGDVVNEDVLALVCGTYSETSPSGTGVRAFMLGELPPELSDKKANGLEWPFRFEVFNRKGFVTFTGRVLPEHELVYGADTVVPLSPQVIALCRTRWGAASESGRREAKTPQGLPIEHLSILIEGIATRHASDPTWPKREPWLRVGMGLHHETGGAAEALDIWDKWSARLPGYVAYEDVEAAWNSFGKRTDGPMVTVATLEHMAGLQEEVETPAASELRQTLGALAFDVVTEDVTPATQIEAGAASTKFRIVPAHEFARRSPPRWIVRGVLPRAGLGVLFGESGSGKTFFVLDLVCAVARGVEWRQHRVAPGRVVYIAAEGASGVASRLRAYERHYGIDLAEVPLGVIEVAPNLLIDDDGIALAECVAGAGGAAVIVIDTLAQVTPGADENAGKDIGRVIARCNRLAATTGALVLLIHHAGKDASKGARGWSGLRAAADVEIEVSVNASGVHCARITKQKDGEQGREFHFKLTGVVLGTDDDGEVDASCIVESAIVPAGGAAKRPKGPLEVEVWKVANDLSGIGAESVPIAALIQQVASSLSNAAGKRDRRPERVSRTIESMQAKGFFRVQDDLIRLPHAT